MIKICTKVNPNFIVFFKAQFRLAMVFGQNIHIYNSESGDLIKILFQHKNDIKLLHEDGNNFFALDEGGVLTVWSSEHLYLTHEKQFPRKVTSSCITSNSEFIYYSSLREQTLFKVSVVGINTIWDYSEEVFPRVQISDSNQTRLTITQNNRFILEYGDHSVLIYDTESQTLVSTVKHMTNITALEVHPLNESVIIGDRNGRIHFYHGVFTSNAKIISSSMHWHSHAVRALCMSSDATQLLSGSEEGVIVFWHLITNKKTFCPRLGSTIVALKIDFNRTSVAALLNSNILKIIQMSNFEEIGYVGSFTNPGDFTHNKAYLEDVWDKGIKVHPKTNFVCGQSLPGQIQLFDIWNFQRVKDIQVIDRNFTSKANEESQSPVLVGLYSFSNDGKYLATVEQRYSHKDNFFLNTLKFWTEDSLTNYQINTLVEHPHGLSAVKDLIYIELNDNTPMFATVGEDNIIKLWGKREKRQPVESDKVFEQKGYIWGPIGEITYKKLSIQKLKYVRSLGADSTEVLIFNADKNLVLWDLKNFKPLSVLSFGGEFVKDFEFCKDKIVISTGRKLWIFDVVRWKITHQIPLLSIIKLLYNEFRNFLYILTHYENRTAIIILDLETFAVQKAIVLKDKIKSLVIVKSHHETQARVILLCEDWSLYVLDEDIQDNMIDVFDKSSALGERKKELNKFNGMGDESQKSKIEKLAAKDKEALNVNMLNFFPQKTHLLPPVSLIYKPLIEKFLIKTTEVEKEISYKKENVLDQMTSETEMGSAVNEQNYEDNMNDFIRKFSSSISKAFSEGNTTV